MTAPASCSCGCSGPLVSVDPDGRHWHEETRGALTTRPPDRDPQQLLDQACASLGRVWTVHTDKEN